MKHIVRWFLVFMILYHVIHTFFWYGLSVIDPFLLSVSKDIVWLLLVAACGIMYWKEIPRFLQQRKIPLLLFVWLLLRSIFLSLQHNIWRDMIMVGIKYDIYPLLIFVTALFLWSVCSFSVYKTKEILLSAISWRRKIAWFILVLGLLIQLLKWLFPDIFSVFGYGAVGDYVLGQHPPLYYRTWPGGVMRLQWLFSGPNNYGFMLVSYFSLLIWYMVILWKQWRRWLLVVVYSASVVWTLSRWVWVGIAAQSFLLILFFRPQWKKYLLLIVVMILVAMFAVANLKVGSTTAHLAAWFSGRDAFIVQPWWYGLASAGPAVHRDAIYLPENHYLQLLLDIGIPWFFLRFGVLGSIFWKLRKRRDDVKKHYQIIVFLFFVWCIWLLIEWLFLHVFEDSMVNYLFFVPFGIAVWSSFWRLSP